MGPFGSVPIILMKDITYFVWKKEVYMGPFNNVVLLVVEVLKCLALEEAGQGSQW